MTFKSGVCGLKTDDGPCVLPRGHEEWTGRLKCLGEQVALDFSEYPGKPRWRLEHGVQVIWKNPESAGVSGKQLENWPASANWFAFDTHAQRETFVSTYVLDYGDGHGPVTRRDVERLVYGVRLVATTEWEVEHA